MVFDNFPWTNIHELNLNWLIRKVAQLEAEGSVRSLFQATGAYNGQTEVPDDDITQVPLVSQGAIYTGDAFEIGADGGIRAKESGLYKVDASLYMVSRIGSTSRAAYIYAGFTVGTASEVAGTRVKEEITDVNFHGVLSIAPKLINLSAGESVYLMARVTDGTGRVYEDAVSTYLLIEKIK